MKTKFLPVNILLAIIIIFFSVKISEVWFGTEKEICKVESAKKTNRNSKRLIKRKKTSLNSYQAFVDQDLFNPDRRGAASGEAEVKEYKPNTQCVLYGILISNNDKSALILEKKTKVSRIRKTAGQKPKWVKTGEKIGPYTVEKIFPDRVILTNHNVKTEILLNDPDNPKRRKKPLKTYRKLKKTKPATKRAKLLNRLPKLRNSSIRKKED
jgi:type II secretory pathway component PulC